MSPAALALVVVMVAGCSGGTRGPADDGATLGGTVAPTPVTAPEVPAPSPAGTGVVVVGRSGASFAVTACQLTTQDATSATLVSVTGAGTTAGGIPFTVEVQRTATSTVAETFTDTVTYADTARILQLQRFEVDGEITDLRQPSARGVLLRVRASGISASGIGGPPGSVDGDDGLVGIAIDATCA